MKHATIRWIELWVGRPACALLTLHRWLLEKVRPPAPDPVPRRILFLKLIEQGSTVLAVAALRRAVEMVGATNVFFCAFAENREIVDILGLIPPENVIPIRADRFDLLALDSIRALRRMRALGIDATVDFEFFARAPAILAYLSGARHRVGLHRFTAEGPYRGDLMTRRVQYNPYLHTSVTFQLLVEALQRDPGETPLVKIAPFRVAEPHRFEPSDDERQNVRQLLESEAGRPIGGRLVVLNPNAHDRLPLRRWPVERFVELGRRILAEHPDVTLVLTGAPGERAAAEETRRDIDAARTVNVAGRTTLRQALVVYGLADAMVTNDSGPAHFASMTGTRVVVLFGPEHPALYGALGDRARAHWAGIACSPCVNVLNHRISPCSDNVCMRAIQVDEVYASVRDALSLASERAG